MSTIILSHALQDTEIAHRLAHGLEQFGNAIWLDEWRLEPDCCIPKALEGTPDHIDFMLVLLSRQAVDSVWLERDWKREYWDMVQANGVTVFPVCVDECEVPAFLPEDNVVSLFKDPEGGIRELQNLIDYYTQKQLLTQSKPVPDRSVENKARLLGRERDQRNQHWDRVQEFINGLQGKEKLRIQKLNTAYYLEYYHLTVAHLKECFQFLEVYHGGVDNELDDDLIYAIIQFQVEQDLPYVDGIFGPLTYTALAEAIMKP
jgi:hypothetical protein